MITFIRKSFKKNTYRVVLWVTLLALAGIFSLPQFMKNSSGPGAWAVSVNGHDVLYEDFMRRATTCEQRMRLIREQYGAYADLILQRWGNSKQQAYNSLVDEELVLQAADTIGIHIDQGYAGRKLNDVRFVVGELSDVVPAGLVNPAQGINQQALRKYLSRQGLTFEDFEQSVENQLKKHVTLEMVGGAATVSQFELRNFYTLSLPRSFSIISFPHDKLIAEEKQKGATDADIKAFFERNAKKYEVAEKRSGVRFVFKPELYGLSVSDADVATYYNAHKRTAYLSEPASVHIRRIVINDRSSAGQARAKKVYEEVTKNPDKFAEIVRLSSDDKATAAAGGAMPWFKRGEQEAALERAAFVLQKNGDISPVISTPEGLQIIQRIDKKMPVYKELGLVKDEIKKTLLQQQFNEHFARDMKRVMSDKTEMAALVEAKKAQREMVADMVHDGSPLSNALFRGNEHDIAFYQEEGKGIVVHIQKVHKAYVPALKSIEHSVVEDLYRERASKAMKKILAEAKKAVSTTPMSEIRGLLKGAVTSTGMISQDQTNIEKLAKQGLPAERMMALEKIGSVLTYEAAGHGYVIRLDEIAPFKEESFQAQRQELAASLLQAKKSVTTGGFVASLYRNATIKSNENLLNTTEENSI